jgi:hypothetical protein
MAGKWAERAKAAKAAAGGGGKYAKLGDGESIDFVLPDPENLGEERSYWLDGKTVPPDTRGAKENVKIVLGIYDLDAKANRVLRVSTGTFSDLGKLLDKYGERIGLTISREGSGIKDTKYKVSARPGTVGDDVWKHAADCEPVNVLDEAGVTPLPEADEPAAAPAPTPKPRPAAAKAAPAAMPPDPDVPF